MSDAAGAGLVAVVVGRDIAVAIVDAAVVEADRRDHAVTVEPVRKPLAAKLIATRAVAEQRAAQAGRHVAVDFVDPVAVLFVERAEPRAPGIGGLAGHAPHCITTSSTDRRHHRGGEGAKVGGLAAQPRANGDGVQDGAGHAARLAGEGFLGRSLAAKARSRLFSIAASSSLVTAAICGWVGDSTAAVPTIM